MSTPRPLYRKHNSFVEFRHDEHDAARRALARVAELRSNPDASRHLSHGHGAVLARALGDLLDGATSEVIRFTLSPHVVDEMTVIPDERLADYLVHRYRYEIFPQTCELDDFPPYLQIEPSSICNYRCVFCFETDPTFTDKMNGFMGRMTLDLFKQVVDAAHGRVEFLSLASRGEPLACPEIAPMLAYTRGRFLNLKLNTNASLLDERKAHAILSGGVTTVVFSADAAEEPLYSQLRVNGKLSVVLKNIEQFQRIRQTEYSDRPIITRVSGVKFSDDQELDSMQRLWGGLVDQVAFVQYNPWENVYESQPHDVLTPCSDLFRRMFVWWDGKVNPCDVDYKSSLSVGRFPERDLSALWRSEAYEAIRTQHLSKARSELSPCNRCSVI